MNSKRIAYDVLLLGAGQLGSRYLQGLVKTMARLNITVVDPSPSSLETAKSRWIEAVGECCHHQIRWLDSVPRQLESIDLVLVVTSANGRPALVEQIASQMKARYWVLEKVLAQSVDGLAKIIRATSQSQGAWVNTTRRMMVWHQALQKVLNSRGPITVARLGGQWGLACNSIHFLDLVSWWAGEEPEVIDTSGLDSIWFESKRAGYFEVTGRLIAQYSLGTTLVLEARQNSDPQPLRVDLADGTYWEVDEANGIALSSGGERIHGCLDFQSQLTARLVDSILLKGQCDLPMLKESVAIHSVFLEAMRRHWNLSQSRNDLHVPIT